LPHLSHDFRARRSTQTEVDHARLVDDFNRRQFVSRRRSFIC
jgi:hypothetical protein